MLTLSLHVSLTPGCYDNLRLAFSTSGAATYWGAPPGYSRNIPPSLCIILIRGRGVLLVKGRSRGDYQRIHNLVDRKALSTEW